MPSRGWKAGAGAFASWPFGLALLVLGLVCTVISTVRVSVDRRGVTVGSALLPRPRLPLPLPLATITSAATTRIDPVADFGGWGYRLRPNRRGVVLRSGEALSVRTTSGTEYLVTVEDSTTAAALLNGLVERHSADVPGDVPGDKPEGRD
ncbi:hypothetical protein ACGFYY_35415 [Streptomyces sp. NPDC048331]|uniref:hypothetical protein n=1 Tax=Streptomyces sp. NPDC048331 TaxID=3365534 RepID=UPI00371D7561